MYREIARGDYLNLAKCKKRTGKRIRKAIKKQLQYVRRDLRYIDEPIVRGKAKNPTEFGAKLDLSIDNGLARVEKLSFNPYNESEVLIGAIEQYYERNGHYPERVLVDKIYRNRKNINYCKLHDIRLSGPTLGRPKKDSSVDKKLEYIDSVDRIEVERAFSLANKIGLNSKLFF